MERADESSRRGRINAFMRTSPQASRHYLNDIAQHSSLQVSIMWRDIVTAWGEVKAKPVNLEAGVSR